MRWLLALCTGLALLLAVPGSASAAANETGAFRGLLFWYRTPAGSAGFPNCYEPGSSAIADLRPSAEILPNRLPRAATEVWYLQLEIHKTVNDVCRNVDLTPTVTLPAGMRLDVADEPYGCYEATNPPKDGSGFTAKACDLNRVGTTSSYQFTGAFRLFDGTYYRLFVPVVATQPLGYTATVRWDVDAVGIGYARWTLQAPVFIPDPQQLHTIAYWETQGGPSSSFQLPDTDVSITTPTKDPTVHMEDVHFTSGKRLIWGTGYAVRVVPASFDRYWTRRLGIATTDARWVDSRHYRQDFQFGSIAYDTMTERTAIHSCLFGAGSMNC